MEAMHRIVKDVRRDLSALIELCETSIRESIGIGIRLMPNELALYSMIRDGYFRDIGQAAETIDVSRATLNRCLRSLKEKELITKEGNKKSGTWLVTEQSTKTDD